MATKIYDTKIIKLVNGDEVYLTPLKIKYLREFLEAFELVKTANGDDDAIQRLTECARIAMKQYYPAIKTIGDLEDNVDLPTLYEIIDIAAGIKIGDPETQEQSVKDQATDSGATWDSLDLAKLESELFILGIWKDYEELETSLSMPEITETLKAKRELDYQDKKFAAGLQGVDLDEATGKQDAWEEMKARVFSGGKTDNPDDVLALQGVTAQKAGFGIGMGLEYESFVEK